MSGMSLNCWNRLWNRANTTSGKKKKAELLAPLIYFYSSISSGLRESSVCFASACFSHNHILHLYNYGDSSWSKVCFLVGLKKIFNCSLWLLFLGSVVCSVIPLIGLIALAHLVQIALIKIIENFMFMYLFFSLCVFPLSCKCPKFLFTHEQRTDLSLFLCPFVDVGADIFACPQALCSSPVGQSIYCFDILALISHGCDKILFL